MQDSILGLRDHAEPKADTQPLGQPGIPLSRFLNDPLATLKMMHMPGSAGHKINMGAGNGRMLRCGPVPCTLGGRNLFQQREKGGSGHGRKQVYGAAENHSPGNHSPGAVLAVRLQVTPGAIYSSTLKGQKEEAKSWPKKSQLCSSATRKSPPSDQQKHAEGKTI